MSIDPLEPSGQSAAHFHIFTEEQQQLRKEIRDFAAREIAPNVMRWDEASEFPADMVRELGRMGLMGVIFPAEYGGSGLGYVEYVIAIEELSRVDGSIGIIVASHNSLAANHIFLAGTEEQRKNMSPGWPVESGWARGALPSRALVRMQAALAPPR